MSISTQESLEQSRLRVNIARENESQKYRLQVYLERIDPLGKLTPEEYRAEVDRITQLLQPIPSDTVYFFKDYGYERADQLEWSWSYTFGCWGCKVRFGDGQVFYTYPKPKMIPITAELKEELKEELTRLGFYDQDGNSQLLIDDNPEEIR